MKVHQLMSENIVSVSMDDLLRHVKSIFEATNFHHLLVIENERLLGIISDRDLLKALSPKVDSITATTKDLASLNKKAHQIMTRNVMCLDENDNVKEAVNLFNCQKISCIPIKNQAGKPVGILSWRDIMRALAQKNQ